MGHSQGQHIGTGAASEAGAGLTLAEIAARVHTVNADTGLSTDFLNLYNELSMLLDLAADDPDMLEDLEGWKPRSYEEHFAASGFKDWQLVIAAYHLCPPDIRAEFDTAVDVLNSAAAAALNVAFKREGADGNASLGAYAAEIQGAIVHLGGLINGTHAVGSQARIDTLLAKTKAEQLHSEQADEAEADWAEPAPADEGDALDQDAIDALFD